MTIDREYWREHCDTTFLSANEYRNLFKLALDELDAKDRELAVWKTTCESHGEQLDVQDAGIERHRARRKEADEYIAELKAEIERLRGQLSPFMDLDLLEVERIKAENEELAECCTRRGAKMQKLYELLRMAMQREHINASEWLLITNWFDADGVPIDAALQEDGDE